MFSIVCTAELVVVARKGQKSYKSSSLYGVDNSRDLVAKELGESERHWLMIHFVTVDTRRRRILNTCFSYVFLSFGLSSKIQRKSVSTFVDGPLEDLERNLQAAEAGSELINGYGEHFCSWKRRKSSIWGREYLAERSRHVLIWKRHNLFERHWNKRDEGLQSFISMIYMIAYQKNEKS